MNSIKSADEERVPFSVQLLISATFMMNIGSFAIMPFLVLYLSHTLHFSSWEVATVLTVTLVCARVLPFFTGMIGDRTSHSTTLVSGMIIRGLGFIGYAFFTSFVEMVCSAALIGIGSALYDPSVKAIFAGQTDVQRKRAFTFFNQALNGGAVLGPLVGGLLVTKDPLYPFLCGGGITVLLGILLLFFRKHYQTVRTTLQLGQSFRNVWGNKVFVSFTCIMTLFWIVFSQLHISYPLEAFRITNDEGVVGTLYIVAGIAGVLTMFVIRSSFQKRSPLKVIQIGLLLMGSSFLIVPLFPIPSLIWILFCVVLFTVGETYILPGSDLAIAELVTKEDSGAYYGMSTLSWAVGGTIGNYIGAYLMENGGTFVPWMIYGAISIVGCLLLLQLERQLKQVRQQTSYEEISS